MPLWIRSTRPLVGSGSAWYGCFVRGRQRMTKTSPDLWFSPTTPLGGAADDAGAFGSVCEPVGRTRTRCKKCKVIRLFFQIYLLAGCRSQIRETAQVPMWEDPTDTNCALEKRVASRNWCHQTNNFAGVCLKVLVICNPIKLNTS